MTNNLPYPRDENLLAETLAAWKNSRALPQTSPQTLSPAEHQSREQAFDRFLVTLYAESKHLPRNDAESHTLMQRLLDAFLHMAKDALHWEARHLEYARSMDFMEIMLQFARQARRVFPDLLGSEIFQAGRNVWAMNSLQAMLGLPVRLTPSIFGYSMLYPLTDNLLDDRRIPASIKRSFQERFRQRLEDVSVVPTNAREETIFRMVWEIESEYSRVRYPQVYSALLLIHQKQGESIVLQSGEKELTEEEVLALSLAKGGASVLADGILVAGSLTPEQESYMYRLGGYLQLLDDLEDLPEDLHGGRLTIFSQAARKGHVDRLTEHTLAFGAMITHDMASFAHPSATSLRELMSQTLPTLAVNAAGQNNRYHSVAFLRSLEATAPFRFAPFRRLQGRLAHQQKSLFRLVEAMALT